MNPKPIDPVKYPELAGALPALLRARKQAEKIALATGTRIVQVVDGKIVRVQPEPSDTAAPLSEG